MAKQLSELSNQVFSQNLVKHIPDSVFTLNQFLKFFNGIGFNYMAVFPVKEPAFKEFDPEYAGLIL